MSPVCWSLSRNVRLSVVCATFLRLKKSLLTPNYKGQKSNRPIAKRFLGEMLGKDISLRFRNFVSEVVVSRRAKKSFFLLFATHC